MTSALWRSKASCRTNSHSILFLIPHYWWSGSPAFTHAPCKLSQSHSKCEIGCEYECKVRVRFRLHATCSPERVGSSTPISFARSLTQTVMPLQCCRCNGSGRCRAFKCVWEGRTCTSCSGRESDIILSATQYNSSLATSGQGVFWAS